jgi:Zn-dependent protease with chaperone function
MMTAAVGLLQLALLTALGFTAVTALGGGALYAVARARLLRWAPAHRARALFLWAGAPLLLGVLLTVLCFAPSLLSVLTGAAADHCLSHDDHHAHLCVIHRPASAGGVLGWSVLVVALLGMTAAMTRDALAVWRSGRASRALLAGATADPTRDMLWLPVEAPVAFTTGLRRPQVVLAESLRSRLHPELLEAVIAHEQAHRGRRDTLRLCLAAALSRFHLGPVRWRLLADFRLACEQAVDERAARSLGNDRLCIAAAIVAMERLAAVASPLRLAFASTFGGSDVPARIERLLASGPPGARFATGRWLLVAIALAGALADSLHHVAESLLSPFVQ